MLGIMKRFRGFKLGRKRAMQVKRYVPENRKAYFEGMSGLSTARRCSECPAQANQFRFTADDTGAKDKSSKRPVCSSHGKLYR